MGSVGSQKVLALNSRNSRIGGSSARFESSKMRNTANPENHKWGLKPGLRRPTRAQKRGLIGPKILQKKSVVLIRWGVLCMLVLFVLLGEGEGF